MVQTSVARNALINQNGISAESIVVLDDLPAGKLSQILLAVFEGCCTGYVNSWGCPAAGVVAKGAKCGLGFRFTIFRDQLYPDGSPNLGAETWSKWFWLFLNAGYSVTESARCAGGKCSVSSNCRSTSIFGDGALSVVPARYGN